MFVDIFARQDNTLPGKYEQQGNSSAAEFPVKQRVYQFFNALCPVALACAWPPRRAWFCPPKCGVASASGRWGSTSRHHLVPKAEGGRFGEVVDLCQPCHSSVHRFLSNRELACRYATVEALRQAEELQGYLHWVRRQRVERIRNRRGRAPQ